MKTFYIDNRGEILSEDEVEVHPMWKRLAFRSLRHSHRNHGFKRIPIWTRIRMLFQK